MAYVSHEVRSEAHAIVSKVYAAKKRSICIRRCSKYSRVVPVNEPPVKHGFMPTGLRLVRMN